MDINLCDLIISILNVEIFPNFKLWYLIVSGFCIVSIVIFFKFLR